MAITVTATAGGNTSNGMALRVYVLTGAALVQNGATATQSAAAAHNASITTTVTGSQVYGAILNGANATPTVFDANTTLIDNVGDAGHTKDYTTCKATSVTGTPGPITLGCTDNNNGGIALYEVLPNGTIAQDPSGPALASTTAATTLTTASFSPPGGSVLIALVASNGTTNGTVTMAVTDTSALTWTAQAQANASNMKYAGVFTAVVPQTTPFQAALPGPAWLAQFARGTGRVPVTAPALGFVQGLITNNFEAGVASGTAISTANSGGLAGTPFTTTNSAFYDNTHVAHGGLAMKLATAPNNSSSPWVRWNGPLGYQAQIWFRFYFYAIANPAGTVKLLTVRDPKVNSSCGIFVLNAAGTLSVQDSTGTSRATTASTIPLNQWCRIEGRVYGDAANGSLSLSLYSSPESVAATETITSTGQNTTGWIGTYEFGSISGQAGYGPYWYDDVAISTAGYPGPSVVLANSFEGTASGTTLTGGSGGNTAAGGSYLDTVSIGANTTLAFDTSQAAHGTTALKVATAGTNTLVYAQWDSQLTAAATSGLSTVWYRFYLYLLSLPGSHLRLWAANSATGSCAAIQMNTSGTLTVTNSNGSNIGGMTTTNGVVAGQWCRIEGYVTASPSAGTAELKLFLNPDAAAASETKTSTAVQNTGNLVTNMQFGISAQSGSGAGPFWLDDIGAATDGYLGPSTGAGPSDGGPLVLHAMPGQAWLRQFQPQMPRALPVGDSTVSAQVLTQALAATAATAGALAQQAATAYAAAAASAALLGSQASKALAVTSSTAGTVARALARALLATAIATGSGTFTKVIVQALAAAVTTAATLTRQAQKALPVSAVTAASLTRALSQALTATTTTTASAIRQAQRAVAVSVALTGTLTRQAGKLLPVTAGSAGVLTRQAAKAYAGSAATAGSLIRQAVRALAATVATTASVLAQKAALRTLAATVASAAVLARQPGKALAASASTTGSLARQAAKACAVGVTLIGSLARQVAKALAAAVTATATAVVQKVFLRTWAATVTVTAVLARQGSKALAAGTATTGALARALNRALAGSAATTAALARQAGKACAATVAGSASLTRRVGKALASSCTAAGALASRSARSLAATAATAGSGAFPGSLLRSYQAAAATAASLTRQAGRPLAGQLAATASLASRAGKALAATVTTTAVAAVVNAGRGIVLAATVGTAGAITRRIATALRATVSAVASGSFPRTALTLLATVATAATLSAAGLRTLIVRAGQPFIRWITGPPRT